MRQISHYISDGRQTESVQRRAACITAYPFWSLTVIILDIVVLWALIVHGDKAARV